MASLRPFLPSCPSLRCYKKGGAGAGAGALSRGVLFEERGGGETRRGTEKKAKPSLAEANGKASSLALSVMDKSRVLVL